MYIYCYKKCIVQAISNFKSIITIDIINNVRVIKTIRFNLKLKCMKIKFKKNL